ncbi:MAG: hypothetical protein JWP87_434 [Labilithrix sp.]|nr:hypothetical protein [Labilithrix sp.]
MRAALLSLVAAGALAALAACSSSIESPPPPCEGVAPAEQETCLTDHYFHGYSPLGIPACPFFVPTTKKLDSRREITFFLGGGTVVDAFVRAEGQFLQRYYEPYALSFFTRQPAAPSGLAFALDATNAQLADLSRQVGLAPGQKPTAEQQKALEKATGDLIFANLRNFIRAQSNPPRKSINVVVLSHIASPDVAAQFQGGVIAGLGLSPTLFQNVAADDASKNLFELIGLGEDFTPTLFVGHDDVVSLAKSPDVIVAHELGHAMGLQHTKEPGNLMTQFAASNACVPGLSDDEIEVIKTTAAVAGAPDALCAWHRLFEMRDSVVRAVLAQR